MLLVIDDAGIGFSQYEWASFEHRMLTKDLETMGAKKQIFLMLCQHPDLQNRNAGRLLNYRSVTSEDFGFGKFKVYRMGKDMMKTRGGEDWNSFLSLNGNPVMIYNIPRFPVTESGKIDTNRIGKNDKEFAKFYNEYEFTIKPKRLKEYRVRGKKSKKKEKIVKVRKKNAVVIPAFAVKEFGIREGDRIRASADTKKRCIIYYI